MKQVRIPWQGWVLVCDGAKALLLRNEGDATLLNLKLVESLAHKDSPTHEQGADQPGRVFQSHGGARSAVEQTDWHAQAEAAFLAKVAGELDHLVPKHSVKNLTVVAPPKALGVLRGRFSHGVRAVVSAEIAKDLVKLSTSEIEKHLAHQTA